MRLTRRILIALLCAALALLCATLAHAHVLLTTPYVVTGPNGVTACSAPHLTMTSSSWTWGSNGGANLISVTYSFGTATFAAGLDSNFVVASCAPTITNVLNLTTGVWVLTMNGTGQIGTGTLSGPQLTGAIAAFTGPAQALRDFSDYFLATWQPSHVYALNTTMVDPAGHTQKVTTAGTSGAALPVFNDAGGATTDGNAVWTDQGAQTGLPGLMGTQQALWGSGDQ